MKCTEEKHKGEDNCEHSGMEKDAVVQLNRRLWKRLSPQRQLADTVTMEIGYDAHPQDFQIIRYRSFGDSGTSIPDIVSGKSGSLCLLG